MNPRCCAPPLNRAARVAGVMSIWLNADYDCRGLILAPLTPRLGRGIVQFLMRKTRHLIAVTLVATALCADRAALAVPSQQPVTQLAGQFIQRLSNSFGRVLPAARLYRSSRYGVQPVVRPMRATVSPQAPPAIQLSPFYFRLPPPLA